MVVPVVAVVQVDQPEHLLLTAHNSLSQSSRSRAE